MTVCFFFLAAKMNKLQKPWLGYGSWSVLHFIDKKYGSIWRALTLKSQISNCGGLVPKVTDTLDIIYYICRMIVVLFEEV